MSSTLSVSKGCFIFKREKSGRKRSEIKRERAENILFGDPWYVAFKETWRLIEEKIKVLHKESFSVVIDGLISFIVSAFKDCEWSQVSTLPTTVLLTGINMPDHESLFSALSAALREKAIQHLAILSAHKCTTLNAAIEQMVSQFIIGAQGDCEDGDSDASDSGDEERGGKKRWAGHPLGRLKMHSLRLWYKQQKKRQSHGRGRTRQTQPLVVVVPHFEKFPATVLQDLILILSGERGLPFSLVLGVATSIVAVHRSLPHRVTATLCLKVLHSPASVDLLSRLLEEVLFSAECPFRLGSRIFNFLIDLFLCCDLSVKGFLQALKFCLLEHMCGQPWKILCCAPAQLRERTKALTKEDMSALRQLPSFVRFLSDLETCERQRLLTDDDHMKMMIMRLLQELHESLKVFHCALRCLCTLTADLPEQPLGTHERELYGQAVGSPLWQTPAYKACFRLLTFLSREELLRRVQCVAVLLHGASSQPLTAVALRLSEYVEELGRASTDVPSPHKQLLSNKMSRHSLREGLLAARTASPWEEARTHLLDFLSQEALPQMLSPPARLPLAELLFFEGSEGSALRAHIAAAPRAALHTALHRPHSYLQCSCCGGDSTASLPDIVKAHTLYRECGRFINLFDWLQAFAALSSPDSQDELEIDDCLQARFTRAVAELQFLGFLKTSSRKVDHVVKLSFDGAL